MHNVTDAERAAMAELVRRAHDASHEPGKAGIAAALLCDGEIIAEGANHVHLQNNPTLHAEIVALGRAAEALDRPDLSDCTLLSTLQPCEMCLAAMRFAGINRVIFAARQENVPPRYFAFPHLKLSDFLGPDARFKAVGGLMEAEVLPLYEHGQE
ncbi:nucleoside deaminase [Rhodobacter sp. NTK016B]|uniref:nucleoside deaminase n=1 Tax=Rhodobacter sp. NTK016B TaxID=2759676 RepID=UPI001A8FBCC7|nr:nucleoside deaminase [Rhodobacter sp. NTK016B]MBN8293525.1 nucleoside deaminase [Rhodobacter sp. NTK016B]